MSRAMGIAAAWLLVVGSGAGVLADEQADESKESEAKAKSVHDFTVQDIDGKPVKLSHYTGNVLLIVNVASECGLTERNYKKLEPLYQQYKDKGLRILAFPANNFGQQEPGTNEQIKQFCTAKYNATYDLFAKVSVKGGDICPLYEYLTKQTPSDIAGEVQWNFQKYLVGRDGTVIARFGPRTDPDDKQLIGAIDEALATPDSGKAAIAEGD